MKKIILSFLMIIMCTLCVQAKAVKGGFSQIINDSGINKDSVAISIRDAENGNVVYSLNDKIMMNPASLQKVLTMTAAAQTLGEDFKFSTELYSVDENSYLIKLSGDPYLRYSDLKNLTRPVKVNTQNIFIDDNVLDSKTWGEGWQWDDDMNTLMQRFGAYNLDKNLIKLHVVPSENGGYAQIVNPSKYPLVFINTVTTSNKTALDVKRDNSVSDNTIILKGTVARLTAVNIPSTNIKRYFEIQLTRALGENKIYLKNPYVFKEKKAEYNLENSIEREISVALKDILQNSNNMAAETVFKLAGGKYTGGVGTDTGAIAMFNDFCKKKNIDSSVIKITDGSGVSKNNLVNADFVSEFLYVNKDNSIMEYLPKPGEGTLVQRMLPIKENLKAKTGTLSNVSTIAGYLTTKNGHKYTFCIMQNDVKLSPADKKTLEDYIIREMFLKL